LLREPSLRGIASDIEVYDSCSIVHFVLPIIGIIVLIVTGIALQTNFSSNQVSAVLETTLGVPVYELYADKRDMKPLPDQEIPLP
jgi:cytochrome b subunit of formate dehydrogenase